MKQKHAAYLLLLFATLFGCKKYLEERPDSSLSIPSSVADLQALLDNNTVMNNYSRGLGEACADNYYLTAADWAAMSSEGDRNAYIWGPEYYFDQFPNEWYNYYRTVYTANVVLEHIGGMERTARTAAAWNNAKGSALFFRAFSFHNTAVTWAKTYDSATAAADPGIPLRLDTDFNRPSARASVGETYRQIITDLQEAIPLLPLQPVHVMRPSRPAAYALMARVLLSMRRYEEAGSYADSCLQLKNTLVDYNTLSATANFPLAQYNAEVLFHASGTYTPLLNTRAKVDSVLYAAYAANDLRKTVFFRNTATNTFAFKGNYTGASSLFFGLATDEVYLVRAECEARAGRPGDAMNILNTLLQKRWKTGTFVPFTATDAATALAVVLTERRKELLMRNLRWSDLKRLNREGAGIILRRVIGPQQYTLLPGANRYALPIPAYVINMSGISQNPD